MRVLYLGKYFYPEKGGIESYSYELAKEAAKRYETFVIASNTSRKFSFEKHNNIKVFRLPRIFWFLHAPITLPFIFLIKKVNPDIIHLNVPNPWFELNLLLFSLLHKKEKQKIIVTYHSDAIPYTIFHSFGLIFRDLLLKFFLKDFTNKIIATSKNYVEGSKILKKFEDKIEIIPLGVDVNKFKPIKVKKLKKKVLLFLGRLFPYKGLRYLLKAMKLVCEKRKDIILFICGSGKLRKSLENLAEKLGISDFVKFTGEVTEDEALYYYNLCDVFILPSIYKSEAFGISQLEAMACGKPVISTNLKGSGVPWVNQHLQTGLIVEPRNYKVLAEAISFILKNEKLRKKMGENARKRVLKYFTLEKMIKETFKIYNHFQK